MEVRLHHVDVVTSSSGVRLRHAYALGSSSGVRLRHADVLTSSSGVRLRHADVLGSSSGVRLRRGICPGVHPRVHRLTNYWKRPALGGPYRHEVKLKLPTNISYQHFLILFTVYLAGADAVAGPSRRAAMRSNAQQRALTGTTT